MPVTPPPASGGAVGGSVVFFEEGSAVGTATNLNFVGAGVTATYSGGTAIATISGGTAAGSIVFLDEGNVAGTATHFDVVGTAGTVSYSGGTATLTLSASSGQAPSAAIDRWHQNAYASTASHDTTITAASVGQRIIFVVGSYGRDVNTPTCTNVTFTEVLAANNSTSTYLSVYVGVVAGGASGTTITVTAGSSNVIFATAVIVDDALTPTAVDTASATAANASMAVDCSVGDFIIMGWATDNATAGDFLPLPLVANTPLFTLPFQAGDGLTGLGVAIGLATITHIVGYFGRGGNGNQVGGLVAVS